MSSKAINHGELHGYLTSLGYHRKTTPTHVVYEKPGKELPVILPKISKKEAVRLYHLAAVEQILVLDRVIKRGQLGYSIGRWSATKAISEPSTENGKTELTEVELSPARARKGTHEVRSASSRAARVAALTKRLADSYELGAAGAGKIKRSSPKSQRVDREKSNKS